MENVYDIILEALKNKGYSETKSEMIIEKFLEEQKLMDEVRDTFAKFFK